FLWHPSRLYRAVILWFWPLRSLAWYGLPPLFGRFLSKVFCLQPRFGRQPEQPAGTHKRQAQSASCFSSPYCDTCTIDPALGAIRFFNRAVAPYLATERLIRC